MRHSYIAPSHLVCIPVTGDAYVTRSLTNKVSMFIRSLFVLCFVVFGLACPIQLAVGSYRTAIYVPPKVEVGVQQIPAAPPPPSKDELAIAQYVMSKNKNASEAYALDIAKNAIKYGKINGHDPLLVVALMKVESTFNQKALSPMGAKGLTQVIPVYHTAAISQCSTGKPDIYAVSTNICVGSSALKTFLASSNSLSTALAKYNGSFGDTTMLYSNQILVAYRDVRKSIQTRRNM